MDMSVLSIIFLREQEYLLTKMYEMHTYEIRDAYI